MKTTLLGVDTDHAIARAGDIGTVICRGRLTPERMKNIVSAVDSLAVEAPGRGAFINVIEEHSPVPEAHVRSASSDLLKRISGKLVAVAVVVEGSGLRTTIVRNILVTINLLARSQTPMKFFETVGQASVWVSTFSNPPQRAGDIQGVVEYARAQIATTAPQRKPA